MPRIAWVEDQAATGLLAELYQKWKDANPGRGRMPEILKCISARPDFLEQVMAFTYGLHFADGHLSYRLKEKIATYVSALNQCKY